MTHEDLDALFVEQKAKLDVLRGRRDAFLRKIEAEISEVEQNVNALQRVRSLRGDTPLIQTSGISASPQPQDSVLSHQQIGPTAAVHAALAHLRGQVFTSADVVSKIMELGLVQNPSPSFPEVASKALLRMAKEGGPIERKVKGTGRQPNLYTLRGGQVVTSQ